MSTRSIIVVTGLGKHKDHQTVRLYQHSDGYPTGVLPEIYAGLKQALDLILDLEKQMGDDQSRHLSAGLVANCIQCASVDVYGGFAAKPDSDDPGKADYDSPFNTDHLGNQGDLEWIYVLDLGKMELNIYGGEYTGEGPEVAFNKGPVDPESYADKLKTEYQDRERKATQAVVEKLENLGLEINRGKSRKKKSARADLNKPASELTQEELDEMAAKASARGKTPRIVPDYNTRLDEEFGDLVIKLVKHDASASGMPAYIEAHLGKTPKDKGETVLDLGNYIYRRSGLSYRHTPEYRGKGKSTTLRWFMSWDDLRPVLPNIFKAAGKEYNPRFGDYLPLEFSSLIIQDQSRGVVLMKHRNPDGGNTKTKTTTQTGGSSPGGASTGGVGSGIGGAKTGGAGTGGAATGGASTGGYGGGTVNIYTPRGNKSKTPTNIRVNVGAGGSAESGRVASGGGPGGDTGAGGEGYGGSGKGSGGGGGGAAPDEPENYSTGQKNFNRAGPAMRANPVKLGQIADYLSNSLEHEDDDDAAAAFMGENFGISKAQAATLIKQWYGKKLNTKFLIDDDIRNFIEGIIGKPAFHHVADLTKSGKVKYQPGYSKKSKNPGEKLDEFERAYLEAALWSSTGDDDEPLDKNHSIEDIAPESIAQAKKDCTKFQLRAESFLVGVDEAQAGHDFWLTRNRHGAGFWDRGHPGKDGERLTNIAHQFKELNPIVGDDGKIYFE